MGDIVPIHVDTIELMRAICKPRLQQPIDDAARLAETRHHAARDEDVLGIRFSAWTARLPGQSGSIHLRPLHNKSARRVFSHVFIGILSRLRRSLDPVARMATFPKIFLSNTAFSIADREFFATDHSALSKPCPRARFSNSQLSHRVACPNATRRRDQEN